MFACTLILILFLPVTFLRVALETLFSSRELSDMGICLEDPQILQPMQMLHKRPVSSSQSGHSCLFTSFST